ncbi:TetR family transcriptional regulator [Leucobacter weissii]|uniref:TetR family transcriptional regulator n=1 Tax=Leucobacter weissii TaxID=1983706 RepID=A0A939S619_9MICO|nr:TetR/AcrR family transcriptional regulator [Leucobacter weissii]MBO1901914.1 TetR family transcriptional regulator [Leucobacter weissii]
MSGTRGAATAAAIEDAALDLVLDRGYERVTVDLICEVAGVSQRTFFNHFPTKDDALLGRDVPDIDEPAARRFIVGTGPMLQDALSLVAPPAEGASISRLADRMKAISSVPSLLAGHLARIAAVDDEVRELVDLRLRRQKPEMDERRRLEEAEMLTSLLGAVMRWIAVASSRDDSDTVGFADLVRRARLVLDEVVRDSPPAPADPL